MNIKDYADKFDKIKDEALDKGLTALSNGIRKAINEVGGTMSDKSPAPYIAPAQFDYIKKPKSKYFTVGFGKASVLPAGIPQKKFYIAGYGDNKPAQGVYDAPHAHALWVDDNSGRGGVVFVSIDNVGMLNYDVRNLRASLADFAKLSDCRAIYIMSTHNHAGIDTMGIWGHLPLTGRNPEYMKFLFRQVKKAVIDAYKDKRDGELLLGSIEVPDMQEDIRTPIVYSKTLTRVRFVPKDGSREVYMLNFASHSESLQGCNHCVSADFPGYMREEIRKQTGAETIYFVGAIGGMISMEIENEREIRASGASFLQSTIKIGKKLAGYAMQIEKEKKLVPSVNLITQEFYFEADNSVLMLAKAAGIIKAKSYFCADASLGMALKSEMSYIEIGDLHILMLPGEIFPELVYGGYLDEDESATGFGGDVNPTPLKEMTDDDENLIIFGLANDEVGYVLPPNDFLLHDEKPYFENAHDEHGRKHYEETNSLGPNTAQKIADVFGGILKTVSKAKNA